MSQRKLIIFDLDDTLIDTSDIYWRARSRFIELLTPLTTHDSGFLVERFEQIDTLNIAKYGFSPKRYLITMLETYETVISKEHKRRKHIETAINECAAIITDSQPVVIDGAIDLLKWVSSRFTLVLLTRGDKKLQKWKLQKTDLLKFFQMVKIVNKKSGNTFRALIKKNGFEPKNTWLIGDSIRSDINPGLSVGINCIFYLYKHPNYTWRQEYGAELTAPVHCISKLKQAIEVLKGT